VRNRHGFLGFILVWMYSCTSQPSPPPSVASVAAPESEAALLAGFKAFAEAEVRADRAKRADARSKSPIDKFQFAGLVKGRSRFFLVSLHDDDPTYGIDLRRTDSLVTPYVGTITREETAYGGSAVFRGCPGLQKGGSIEQCLDAGGKLMETDLNAQQWIKRMRYLRQDGHWVRAPDAKDDFSIKEASEPSPLPASWVPYLCGLTDQKP
jgi:hypothetical protein